MIHYRKHSNENVLTPGDLLNKAYGELNASFDLYCEDSFAPDKPHWAFDNYRLGGAIDYRASHLFYTQPSWGRFFAERMNGANRTKLLTYAVDEEVYPEVESDYIYDVGFIGNVTDNDGRQPYIDLIVDKYNCLISSDVPTRDIAKELSKCKVLFNHIRFEEVNIRFFEALACGAQVASYTPTLHMFADENKHYLTFRDEKEAIEKIDFLLESPNRIKDMKKYAREEVLKRHTYKHRVQEVIDFL